MDEKQNNTYLNKQTNIMKKELDILISRYTKELAELEEREDSLIREIDIFENLKLCLTVWYVWKGVSVVGMSSSDINVFVQKEAEEANKKFMHFDGILNQLQQAVQLIKDEETEIKKRIYELKLLSDKHDKCLDKMPETILPNNQEQKIEEMKNKKEILLKHEEEKSKDLLETDQIDWKKACDDLLQQVNELKKDLKDSAKSLKESESYAKHLENKYLRLEMELKEKIELLESKNDELILQKEVRKSKEVLLSMQEALAEVQSLKESLSNLTTHSKVNHHKPVSHDAMMTPSNDQGFTDVIKTNERNLDDSGSKIVPALNTVSTASEIATIGPLELNHENKVYAKQSESPLAATQLLGGPAEEELKEESKLMQPTLQSASPDQGKTFPTVKPVVNYTTSKSADDGTRPSKTPMDSETSHISDSSVTKQNYSHLSPSQTVASPIATHVSVDAKSSKKAQTSQEDLDLVLSFKTAHPSSTNKYTSDQTISKHETLESKEGNKVISEQSEVNVFVSEKAKGAIIPHISSNESSNKEQPEKQDEIGSGHIHPPVETVNSDEQMAVLKTTFDSYHEISEDKKHQSNTLTDPSESEVTYQLTKKQSFLPKVSGKSLIAPLESKGTKESFVKLASSETTHTPVDVLSTEIAKKTQSGITDSAHRISNDVAVLNEGSVPNRVISEYSKDKKDKSYILKTVVFDSECANISDPLTRKQPYVSQMSEIAVSSPKESEQFDNNLISSQTSVGPDTTNFKNSEFNCPEERSNQSKASVKQSFSKSSHLKQPELENAELIQPPSSHIVKTISKGDISTSNVLPFTKGTRSHNESPLGKEIKRLINRYNADLTSLEERKEHLVQQIELSEYLIPIVSAGYFLKLFQNIEIPYKEDEPLPNHNEEVKAREKVESLIIFLKELQQAIDLIRNEEDMILNRIKELGQFISDEHNQVPHKFGIHRLNQGEATPVLLGITDGLETNQNKAPISDDQRITFDEALKPKDIDWKKISENLQFEISELSTKLNTSSQQLREKEERVKFLEEEYAALERQLQSKIQLLEKRQTKLFTDIIDQEAQKNIQEELDNKQIISGLQESLAEVRSLKENLSKYSTKTEAENIDPKVVAVAAAETPTSSHADVSDVLDLLGTENIDLKPSILSPEDVITFKPQKDIISLKPQIFESVTASEMIVKPIKSDEDLKHMAEDKDMDVPVHTSSLLSIKRMDQDALLEQDESQITETGKCELDPRLESKLLKYDIKQRTSSVGALDITKQKIVSETTESHDKFSKSSENLEKHSKVSNELTLSNEEPQQMFDNEEEKEKTLNALPDKEATTLPSKVQLIKSSENKLSEMEGESKLLSTIIDGSTSTKLKTNLESLTASHEVTPEVANVQGIKSQTSDLISKTDSKTPSKMEPLSKEHVPETLQSKLSKSEIEPQPVSQTIVDPVGVTGSEIVHKSTASGVGPQDMSENEEHTEKTSDVLPETEVTKSQSRRSEPKTQLHIPLESKLSELEGESKLLTPIISVQGKALPSLVTPIIDGSMSESKTKLLSSTASHDDSPKMADVQGIISQTAGIISKTDSKMPSKMEPLSKEHVPETLQSKLSKSEIEPKPVSQSIVDPVGVTGSEIVHKSTAPGVGPQDMSGNEEHIEKTSDVLLDTEVTKSQSRTSESKTQLHIPPENKISELEGDSKLLTPIIDGSMSGPIISVQGKALPSLVSPIIDGSISESKTKLVSSTASHDDSPKIADVQGVISQTYGLIPKTDSTTPLKQEPLSKEHVPETLQSKLSKSEIEPQPVSQTIVDPVVVTGSEIVHKSTVSGVGPQDMSENEEHTENTSKVLPDTEVTKSQSRTSESKTQLHLPPENKLSELEGESKLLTPIISVQEKALPSVITPIIDGSMSEPKTKLLSSTASHDDSPKMADVQGIISQTAGIISKTDSKMPSKMEPLSKEHVPETLQSKLSKSEKEPQTVSKTIVDPVGVTGSEIVHKSTASGMGPQDMSENEEHIENTSDVLLVTEVTKSQSRTSESKTQLHLPPENKLSELEGESKLLTPIISVQGKALPSVLTPIIDGSISKPKTKLLSSTASHDDSPKMADVQGIISQTYGLISKTDSTTPLKQEPLSKEHIPETLQSKLSKSEIEPKPVSQTIVDPVGVTGSDIVHKSTAPGVGPQDMSGNEEHIEKTPDVLPDKEVTKSQSRTSESKTQLHIPPKNKLSELEGESKLLAPIISVQEKALPTLVIPIIDGSMSEPKTKLLSSTASHDDSPKMANVQGIKSQTSDLISKTDSKTLSKMEPLSKEHFPETLQSKLSKSEIEPKPVSQSIVDPVGVTGSEIVHKSTAPGVGPQDMSGNEEHIEKTSDVLPDTEVTKSQSRTSEFKEKLLVPPKGELSAIERESKSLPSVIDDSTNKSKTKLVPSLRAPHEVSLETENGQKGISLTSDVISKTELTLSTKESLPKGYTTEAVQNKPIHSKVQLIPEKSSRNASGTLTIKLDNIDPLEETTVLASSQSNNEPEIPQQKLSVRADTKPIRSGAIDDPTKKVVGQVKMVAEPKTHPLKTTDGRPVKVDTTATEDMLTLVKEGVDIKSVPLEISKGKEPSLPTKKIDEPKIETQIVQRKLWEKDHLIKSMADQLREIFHNSQSPGSIKGLEEATSSDPVKTYDFDVDTLLMYLKGEEPQNYPEFMMSNEKYSSLNPLNVKIVKKLDDNSLMIEWGPPPPAEVVGFQIFVNGHFMYWAHSAKRNLALLQPLDLKLLLDITVCPINVEGQIMFQSSTTYKPE
ncbi:uncharacterized protein LOC128986335 [Macrosteles quadrilineatus]|uniref:uncharacterized protein LOC128986335 n=1 Tax=Macrosteles quadrilineatus TaxID=74068 RepID=UPI0023E0B1FB|nr:uncharacterized protein LOC128986335 [Macrosteles quadrilineatus]